MKIISAYRLPKNLKKNEEKFFEYTLFEKSFKIKKWLKKSSLKTVNMFMKLDLN